VSEPEQFAFGLPRAIILRDDIALPETRSEALADFTLISPHERRRNLRASGERQRQEQPYRSPEREADLTSERPALVRQMKNKKPGDPSRSVPLAFDEHGKFAAPLAGRVP